MNEKLQQFVSSLTDQEIDNQLIDILEWAKVYKELLENEQTIRRNNRKLNNNARSTNFLKSEDEIEAPDIPEQGDGIYGVTVNYELSQAIYEKVASFSAEKTKEQLEKLKQVPKDSLCQEDIAELQFEIDTLELHLFELIGETTDTCCVCSTCGSELVPNAKFCNKCGSPVKNR